MDVAELDSLDFLTRIDDQKSITIKNIAFTKREVDVIACVIGGRSYKKIAATLSISIKTVENHIHNIICKIKGNSKYSIIDFIEKSNKAEVIKNHLQKLLLHVEFESTLKKIATTQPTTSVCLILHNVAIKDKLFINRLEKNLKSAGLKIICKPCEEFSLQNCTKNRANKNYIIFILSNKASVLLQGHEKQDVDYINTLLNNNLDNRTYVLADKNANTNMYKKLNNFYCIENTCSKNYYFFVLKLIKVLFNTDIINETITNFISQHEAMTQQFLQEKSLFPQESKKPIKNYNPMALTTKSPLVFATALCIILFIAIISWQYFTNVARMENFSNMKTQPIQEKITLNLPPRNTNFTGRKHALIQIKSQLSKRKFGIITQSISGLGGIGKTQLAIEYAYQAAENNEYSIIMWIPCETTHTIRNAYNSLADHLKIDTTGMDLENIQNITHKELSEINKNTKMLFILDNVIEQKNVTSYLSKIHNQLSTYVSPSILITSRSQDWQNNPIILDVFTKNEAVSFIKKQLPDEKPSSIINLAKQLEFYPLAISQAVAYIKAHTNIDEYLELYKTSKNHFKDFSGNRDLHKKLLWGTWNISIDKLSDSAKKILFISSYLNPDDIPIKFFNNLSIQERAACIRELRKYSFICLTNYNKSFKIHRLLQETIRLTANSFVQNIKKSNRHNSYWLNQAISLFNSNFSFDYFSPENWKNCSQYLATAQLLAEHAITSNMNLTWEGIKIYTKYAMFLTYINNDGVNAIIAWQHILNTINLHYKKLSLITPNIKTHLSCALSWAGNFKEAQHILKKSIPIYNQKNTKITQKERELLDILRLTPFKNNTSIETIANCDLNYALLILGDIQYRLGFIQKSINTLHKAAMVLEKNEPNGMSQYFMIETLGRMGYTHIRLGNFMGAEEALKNAILLINKSSISHPKFSRIYANFSSFMYHIGNFKKSILLLEKCEKLRSKYLSPKHKDHADTYLKLGFSNLMLDNTDLAIQNFKNCELIYKSYNDNDVLFDLFTNLGYWKTYESLGNLNKAADHMRLTFKLALLQYGDNVKNVFSFQLSQAEKWPELKKPINLHYWKESLNVVKKMFGDTHSQTAKYYFMLGQALENSSNPKIALVNYRKALTIINSQNIIHEKLKQFNVKNVMTIQEKINIIVSNT